MLEPFSWEVRARTQTAALNKEGHLGFGGVKAADEQVVINAQLYKKWTGLQFKLVYKGDSFNVKITKDDVAIIADKSNKLKHRFIVSGKSVDCSPGKPSLIKYQQKAG